MEGILIIPLVIIVLNINIMDLFSSLPGILIGLVGMLCFGILLFLGFAVIAKITGRKVGYARGLFYKGQTLAGPDALDGIAQEARKLVNKKYKEKKEVEEEDRKFQSELKGAVQKRTTVHDHQLHMIAFMTTSLYSINLGGMRPYENDILNLIGINTQIRDARVYLSTRILTADEKEKLKQLAKDIVREKQDIIEEIKKEFESKKNLTASN